MPLSQATLGFLEVFAAGGRFEPGTFKFWQPLYHRVTRTTVWLLCPSQLYSLWCIPICSAWPLCILHWGCPMAQIAYLSLSPFFAIVNFKLPPTSAIKLHWGVVQFNETIRLEITTTRKTTKLIRYKWRSIILRAFFLPPRIDRKIWKLFAVVW